MPHDGPKFLIYSDSIQMTITYFNVLTIFGHFFANCVVIFQKTEVQTVILRCLKGLHLDASDVDGSLAHAWLTLKKW